MKTGGDAAFQVLVGCALVLTILLVRRELTTPTTPGPGRSIGHETDWASYVTEENHYGAPGGVPAVVEFGDYECPACRIFQVYLDSLLSLGEPIRLVYRHFPLAGHTFAVPAIRASQCAADQGRFEPAHRLLYAYQDSLGVVPWWWFALRAGVPDSVAFEACLQSASSTRLLGRDTLDGHRLGVRATPTFLVGPRRFTGVPPFDVLLAHVRQVREQMSFGPTPVASGSGSP